MNGEKIVSVGLLSEQDLALLGSAFTRHFPIDQEDIFADLLARLDEVEAVPLHEGVMLQVSHGPNSKP